MISERDTRRCPRCIVFRSTVSRSIAHSFRVSEAAKATRLSPRRSLRWRGASIYALWAEGVETEGQARILTELGCDDLQDYLFSKPLPKAEFEAFLRHAEKAEVAHPGGAR